MRETPQPIDYVAELIPDDPERRETFMSLFTEQAPVLNGRDRDQLGDDVRVRYYGHATLLFESKDVSILTDPLVSYRIPDESIPRYTYADLPETIDYAIITHSHQDHIMFETLLQLRHKIKNIVVPRNNGGALQDPSMRLALEATGFENIIELDELESIEVPGGRISGFPFFGEHGELHIRSKLAYLIDLGGKSAICAADSNNLVPELYDYIRKFFGKTDKTFIGMECEGAPMSWLYGPLMTKPLERRMDQSRRLDGSDCAKGMKMIESLGANDIYVYAMGQEPWLTFVSSIKYTEQSKPIVDSNALIEACKERGYNAERLYGRKEIEL
jgi:L-ascorbate metabolism protein UlaG (beta-lactamase superfamily)